MNTTLIIAIVAVFIAGFVGIFLANLLMRKKSSLEQMGLEDKIAKLSQEALKSNNEQFITLAKEILGSQQKEYKMDFEGKQNLLNKLIGEMRTDLKSNQEKLSKSEEDRIRSFSALKNELESYKQITSELKGTTDNLRSLLSNNQMRGAFGEQVAENLLQMAGFVVGQDYVINQAQENINTRPDFTIFLPDKTKINIDVKFPYASLVKYTEANTKEEKERYLRAFTADIKAKIKQITTRDYINPTEHTVDFVILFIPNEMIFSFIYDKMNDVWEEAMAKKVVMAGPFSFTAILRMVKQAYTNFRYQENLQHIIGLIQTFDTEYQKFSLEVDVLGKRIYSSAEQFDKVAKTRNKSLTSVVDKIKSEKALPDENKDKDPLIMLE